MADKEDQNKKAKQGQDDKITKTAAGDEKDFKGSGIEGVKGADDTLSVQQVAELKEENERLKAENEKLKAGNSEIRNQKSEIKKDYVTGEDAVKALRAAGKDI